jgi:hypothetical protein
MAGIIKKLKIFSISNKNLQLNSVTKTKSITHIAKVTNITKTHKKQTKIINKLLKQVKIPVKQNPHKK